MSEIPNLLNYGLLGLSALIVFLFWRVISVEQKRAGQPRKGIISLSWSFILLALLLSIASMIIEILDARENKEIISTLESKLEKNQVREKSLNEKAARLDEKVSGQIELIKRLDLQIGKLTILAESVHSTGTTNVRVSISGGDVRGGGIAGKGIGDVFGSGGTFRTVTANYRIPENELIKQEIQRSTHDIQMLLKKELQKVEQLDALDGNSAALHHRQ